MVNEINFDDLDRVARIYFGREFLDLDHDFQARALHLYNSSRTNDSLTTASRTNASRTWWMRLLLDDLEAQTGHDRSARGRSAYRNGRVHREIIVSPYEASGRVREASRARYQVVIGCNEQIALNWKSLARAIAENPKYYLDFSENRLNNELAALRGSDDLPLFRSGLIVNCGCTCFDYGYCKHLVSLANAAADLFESDLRVAFRFFGIDYDDFLKFISELREDNLGGQSLSYAVNSHDEYGWPNTKDMKRTTSTKRFWNYMPDPSTGKAAHDRKPVGIQDQIPKNRVTGLTGPMNMEFSRIYQALSASKEEDD